MPEIYLNFKFSPSSPFVLTAQRCLFSRNLSTDFLKIMLPGTPWYFYLNEEKPVRNHLLQTSVFDMFCT